MLCGSKSARNIQGALSANPVFECSHCPYYRSSYKQCRSLQGAVSVCMSRMMSLTAFARQFAIAMPFHLQFVTMPFHFMCLDTLGNVWLCDLQPGRGSTPALITKLVWNDLAWIVSLRTRISEYPERSLCASQTAFLACLHLRELLCPAGVDISWAALRLLPKQMHRSSPRAALPPSVSSLSLRKLQHKPVALALPLLKVAQFPTDLCTLALEIPLPEFLSA